MTLARLRAENENGSHAAVLPHSQEQTECDRQTQVPHIPRARVGRTLARMDHTARRLSHLTAQQYEKFALVDGMRLLLCHAGTQSVTEAIERFAAQRPDSVHADHVFNWIEKAPRAPVDTATGAPLLPPALLDPLIGQLQAAIVPARLGLLRVPFKIPVPIESGAPSIQWIGQGVPKPVSQPALVSVSVPYAKCSGIVVLTDELLTLTPGVEAVVHAILLKAATEFLDRQLVDPTLAAVADKNPASLTNGVTPITSTGDLAADVAVLLGALYTARPQTARPALIMSPVNAGRLAATGLHPDLSAAEGGTAFGVDVVTSVGAGPNVVALDAAAVVYSDGGGNVDASRYALLNMDDAPTTPTASTIEVSLWQANLIGLRVERSASWAKAPNAVQLLTVGASTLSASTKRSGAAS